MTIVGIDPGSQVTGYGIVTRNNGRVQYVASGTIRMRSADPLPVRMEKIYAELSTLLRQYPPDACAVENIFVSRNIQSALKLGQARGACILAAVHANVRITEYSPREVKLAIVGNGAASKKQVAFMVGQLLEIGKKLQEDESDALALALCQARRSLTPRSRVRSWKDFVAAHPERVKKL